MSSSCRKLLRVGDQIALDAREVALDRLEPGEPLAELADELAHRGGRDVPDEVLVDGARVALELSQLAERRLDAFLETFSSGLDGVPLRLRERHELGTAEGLPARGGGDRESSWALEDDESGFPGRFLQGDHLDLLATPQLVHDVGLLALELLALEGAGQPGPAFLDDPGHLRRELPGAAGGKLQGGGPVRIVEVEDVAVVRRGRFLPRRPGQDSMHGRGPAGTRGAHDEHAVAGPSHADAEGRGGHRAILPDHSIEGRELRRGLERQRGGVADGAELLGLERAHHAVTAGS